MTAWHWQVIYLAQNTHTHTHASKTNFGPALRGSLGIESIPSPPILCLGTRAQKEGGWWERPIRGKIFDSGSREEIDKKAVGRRKLWTDLLVPPPPPPGRLGTCWTGLAEDLVWFFFCNVPAEFSISMCADSLIALSFLHDRHDLFVTPPLLIIRDR